jgi:site-specific DNA-adenine methylase
MFYYLGRKKKIAKLYPEPKYTKIIEPFGGSGAYSLEGDRWKNDVTINDLSPITYSLWNYLKKASKKDIECLPNLEYPEKLSDYELLCEEERWLISFHINPGANQKSNVVTKFNRWGAGKRYISENLYKIKHWEILNKEYFGLNNEKATWFIDPPYERSGVFYMTNTITDYSILADWCKDRMGQTIVCEQSGASWLNFELLSSQKIAGKKHIEEYLYVHDN